jgi:lipoprotein-anchoring transpeptidase ErfK/SrfK
MPRLPHRAVRLTTIPRHLLGVVLAAGLLTAASPGTASPISLNEVRTWQVPSSIHAPASAAWTAEVLSTVKARVAPRRDAPVRTVLRSYTPYSTSPARFLATAAARDARGRDWVRVQIAERPNTSSAWVPADAVHLATTTTRIVVRLDSRRVEVWRGQRRVVTYPAGVGRTATPTPTGTFAVEDTVTTPTADRGAYGRFVVTLTAHSNVLKRFNGGDGQIAIHGSGSLGRVGRASSHGCIILDDDALTTVFSEVGPGTPVIVTR